MLAEEAMRMVRARDMRSFGRRGTDARTAVRIIGTLFLRTVERAERIYRAMLSRGFSGDMPSIRRRTVGTADLLFHRWNCEAVDAKAGAAKGSKAKKTDDIQSYVYTNDDGFICIPGEYLRMSIIAAAKFRQDPRSPRKSAMDLYKAAVVPLTMLASLGTKTWDYEDRRRVVISAATSATANGWR